MLLVPIKALKPGMVLAQPIFHPSRDEMMLLARDKVVDAPLASRLVTLGVSHIWVHVPGLEELDGCVNERISSGHVELFNVVESAIDRLNRRVALPMNMFEYKRTVHRMLDDIIGHPEHETITHQLASCGSQLAGHLANCCYLSLLLGAHMSGYVREQRRSLPADTAQNTSFLGLGALLHDIGKTQMPDDLQTSSILDDRASWPEYRMHVQAGFNMVRDKISIVAANVVLNHHQRYDGSGFPDRPDRHGVRTPRPPVGQEIHIFNRIVAVVDAFDRLLGPCGQSVPTIVALSELGSDRFAGWFDPVVVQKLYEIVPPFQVGSIVGLSDGLQAVVMENHPEALCRPTVTPLCGLITDAVPKVSRKQLDLRMCRNTSVVEVDGVDVQRYLFDGGLASAAFRHGVSSRHASVSAGSSR